MKQYTIITGKPTPFETIVRNLHLNTQHLTVTSDKSGSIKSYKISIRKNGVDYLLISYKKLKDAKRVALKLEDKFNLGLNHDDLVKNEQFRDFILSLDRDSSNY